METNKIMRYCDGFCTSEYNGLVIIANTMTGMNFKMTEECFGILNEFIRRKVTIDEFLTWFQDNEDRAYFEKVLEVLTVFSETPEICVEAVDFSYDSKVKIYNNFDYVFHYGKKYGIIGKTGEGKSTIVKLLFGLWSPDSGRITIDERDCSELEYDDLSSIITYVSSTPIIIHDTLYNNLTMYDKNISEDMIWEVLKKVELEELFSDNEDKLNTIIGDNGITLSSGQRQRLSLARTMLIGRRIIILDEPTSALDEATTELITKLLYEEFNDKTLIIISHNKSVLKNCDRILKIEKGKVMEVE